MSLEQRPGSLDDLVCDIEDLEEWLTDLEAKAYSAATQLEFLPYIPTAARKLALDLKEAHPDIGATCAASGAPPDFATEWLTEDPERARIISARLQSLVWATAKAATACLRELDQIRTLAQTLEAQLETARAASARGDEPNGAAVGHRESWFDWPAADRGGWSAPDLDDWTGPDPDGDDAEAVYDAEAAYDDDDEAAYDDDEAACDDEAVCDDEAAYHGHAETPYGDDDEPSEDDN